MSKVSQKFIESHWLTFATKGAVSVVAGLVMMFAGGGDTEILIQVVGATMIALGFIEFVNMMHRNQNQSNWAFPLFLSIIEILIAIALLVTAIPGVGASQLIWLRIILLSAYVFFTSVITIVMGLKNFTNLTDSFMWVVNGMLGSILGLTMLAGSGMSPTTHIEFFGIYLMINGLTDLFFGVHAHDLDLIDKKSRQKLAKQSRGKK